MCDIIFTIIPWTETIETILKLFNCFLQWEWILIISKIIVLNAKRTDITCWRLAFDILSVIIAVLYSLLYEIDKFIQFWINRNVHGI